MLFLLLRLDNACYALDASRVVEVLPLLTVQKIAGAQRGVAGTFNYRGVFIPVVDISELVLGRPASRKLSTRIVVVRRSAGDEPAQRLGLIAENATETMRCEASEFSAPGLAGIDTSYFGPVINGPFGLVQRLDVERLVPVAAPPMSFSESA